jgi:hypothetical protein
VFGGFGITSSAPRLLGGYSVHLLRAGPTGMAYR